MAAILASWGFRAEQTEAHLVFPDGCRDLILVQRPSRRPAWLFSTLDERTRDVRIEQGTVYTGFRLHPGLQSARCGEELPLDPHCAEEQIENQLRRSARTEELLHTLRTVVTVSEAARHLGVTPRTLLRTTRRETGAPASFWIKLARARRMARALRTRPIVWVAAELGYADQAHLTRDCRRWFGMPPTRARAHPGLKRALDAPGFC